MKHELVIGKYTLESLTNGMYASPLDLYREYIQNAVDSFDETVEKRIKKAEKLQITIDIDKLNKRVVIRDNGSGISSQNAVEVLLDIGNSQKSRITSRGFRGIGRLAGLSYCNTLIFQTSYQGEESATIIEFNAALLKELLLPGIQDSQSVGEVMDKIVTIRLEKEKANRCYFEVRMEGVENEFELTNTELVQEYLIQHAPIPYSKDFKWARTITEKIRLEGYSIPQYKIVLNGMEITKPYSDCFISDRVKKNQDIIRDICVKAFYRDKILSAVLWYAQTSFFGTIIDNSTKGIRIRQGNILIGDRGSCNSLFKEERFNGWMIGEIHVVDPELIANSRRDGFEKNKAYLELRELLSEWALGISKEIRHMSYERSLSSSQKTVAEAEMVCDVADENDLLSEDLSFEYSESSTLDSSESDELAHSDYLSKLGMFLNQKKTQTKYTALNINTKLTTEQRKVLERVFDIITKEYEQDVAEKFVNIISLNF